MFSLTRSCSHRLSPLRPKASSWPSLPRSLSYTRSRYKHRAAASKTNVEQYLLDRIKLGGPIPFAKYMQQCLSHPTHGYYMNPENNVFGTRGDFITSPEISQMFGELLAIWLISQYKTSGKGLPVRFIELGPGRGTLMADILRVALKFLPGKDVSVHLVETSDAMRANQKERLMFDDKSGVIVNWHNSVNEISPNPAAYTMFVAHEFFDALPIHMLQKTSTGEWHEVLVTSNIQDDSSKNASTDPVEAESPVVPTDAHSFRYVLSPSATPVSTVLGHSSPRFNDLPAGSMLEVCPTSFRIARKVGELLTSKNSGEDVPAIGGCGLIIDYGADHAFGNSLRAFQNHKIVDTFHQPGNSDLTANVDFAYLKEAMGDLVTTHGPIPQGAFLNNMGLSIRLQGLLKSASTEGRKRELHEAAARLVDPLGMGKQYQMMGITSGSPDSKSADTSPVWPFIPGLKEQAS